MIGVSRKRLIRGRGESKLVETDCSRKCESWGLVEVGLQPRLRQRVLVCDGEVAESEERGEGCLWRRGDSEGSEGEERLRDVGALSPADEFLAVDDEQLAWGLERIRHAGDCARGDTHI